MSRIIQMVSLIFSLFLINNALAGEKIEVSLAYFGSETDMAALGARQGLDEANLQGEFLGQKYILKSYDPEQIKAVSGVSAILASVNEEGLRALARQNPDIPVFNLTDDNNSLRENCVANLFHVIPSQKMRDDAVAQWMKKIPDSKVVAVGWNSHLKKYAASQVNKRFTETHDGKPMDDEAYAGWMAMKIIADAVARTRSADGKELVAFLKNDLVVDGAKGLKMNFRSTGQLRQMMLLVEGDDIVGEAPVRGVADTTDLDSLGVLKCESCTDK